MKIIDGRQWDSAIGRRVQEYGYTYHTRSSFFADEKKNKGPGVKTLAIPKEFEWLCNRLVENKFMSKPSDQIIINEYIAGQGIAPHTDHVRLFGPEVVSVSLLSDIMMDFDRNKTVIPLKLEKNSCVSLKEDARYRWRHSIAKRKFDDNQPRSRRVSLTFRYMK
jgi:alkylated DNA repair dioxygenase AlkB